MTDSDDEPVRAWKDKATGWQVRETGTHEHLAERHAFLREPSTGREYQRAYDPDRTDHSVPVSKWVELVGLAERVPQRQPEVHLRRAQRVLSMVHELHKLGLQRLRIAPFMAPSGGAWRCAIVPRSGTAVRHGALVAGDPPSALYSSGQDNEYFGWRDARRDTARELAAKFLERFPHVAQHGAGEDWAYAGWYVQMLGHAEAGMIPMVFGDGWGPDYDHVPTPGEVRLPMPPPGEGVEGQ